MEENSGQIYERLRPELTAYLCRLVIRPAVAEEITQAAFVRFLESREDPAWQPESAKAWLFRVATNLAIDERRKHSNWRENALTELKIAAEADAGFVASSQELASTPETGTIAREHLIACFACVLRNLPEQKAAALLLKEVHGFSLAESASVLEATENQVKNWLQEARSYMDSKYRTTCALITKEGVCHQCVELDGFFRADRGRPIEGGVDHLAERIELLKTGRSKPWGRWHRMMFGLLDRL
ncbi:MAG: RNA polymerase sigma factor [Deltaproteobacteria bacterium]|nr:RNA polymerase sigma factor [Deltaproteobacteria bacterium]